MKKNNEGFTLIELLATIVILGVLGTIGAVSTNRYLTQSRAKSYKVMSQTIYEATMNCMIQGKCATLTKNNTQAKPISYTTDYLIEMGYLEKLENPISSHNDCNGSVNIFIYSGDYVENSDYQKYKYEVNLKCDGVANAILRWPDTKESNEDNILKKITKTANSSSVVRISP